MQEGNKGNAGAPMKCSGVETFIGAMMRKGRKHRSNILIN
jgi:hypothetical protein